MSKDKITLFWHRRDLRTDDNHGLYRALTEKENVLPLFIFDRNILDELEDRADRRVTFIHDALSEIKETYENNGGSIIVKYGTPEDIFPEILSEYNVEAVYTNRDYEPYAKDRDENIGQICKDKNVEFKTFKDHVIFEKDEVVKKDGGWYSVFSPYKRMWFNTLKGNEFDTYWSSKNLDKLYQSDPLDMPSLKDMGFERKDDHIPSSRVDDELLKNYSDKRDIPSVRGTSRLSVHLRFGTVSIRKMAKKGKALSGSWLNELIWRDFYQMILHFNPQIVTTSFRPEYDKINWRNNEEEFEKWCKGETGYPIVDAGMRELNETGFMHNRVRMIVASFLTKHLLVHWTWGEQYFAKKLIDYELASNNGGWQWAAGSGCDAAPYFRVFNSELQTKKFDPDLKYIKKWVPEFQELDYQQKRIVEHKFARERALETYKSTLK
jgi:deoxyribodipyrimidine photo-lyase